MIYIIIYIILGGPPPGGVLGISPIRSAVGAAHPSQARDPHKSYSLHIILIYLYMTIS